MFFHQNMCPSLDALCHWVELLHQVWMLRMTKMPTWLRLLIELQLRCVLCEALRGSAGQSGALQCPTLYKVCSWCHIPRLSAAILVRMSRWNQLSHHKPDLLPSYVTKPHCAHLTVRKLRKCTTSLSLFPCLFSNQILGCAYDTYSDRENCRENLLLFVLIAAWAGLPLRQLSSDTTSWLFDMEDDVIVLFSFDRPHSRNFSAI